jgi:hypothetical protein
MDRSEIMPVAALKVKRRNTMKSKKEIARMIFEEINKEDDYLMRMMGEKPFFKWKRRERVYSRMLDDTTYNGEPLWEIWQVWYGINNPGNENRRSWVVCRDWYLAINDYEEKNLQKINHNRECIIGEDWEFAYYK